ncbi:Tim9-Tim10 complex subunit Tim9 [Schizosaccharomyces octosporus yFS286]|uniref:Mitochondrial import inner membrane translocase subunit n=1 Tax=Schizosaccharomyces octosporus (strain yFS286) TaxID=483514 RepID=S9R0S5_SCHOY|nr:Tim9-Tim10 complex subunit Tim9 [Schizosaccharomyces octosporus yFS286]EPX72050.1 Tim9-Tim10 complex subunit Tim9 [Schizosaccharomyces octosporus yFS286]
MEYLNQKEQEQFAQVLEAKQIKDYTNMMFNLSQGCFNDCIVDFTSSKVGDKESACLTRCADKFFKHTQRVGQRFAENNAKLMQ